MPSRPDATQLWEDAVVPALERYTAIPALSPAFDGGWEAAGHLLQAAELLAGWARARLGDRAAVRVERRPSRTPLVVVDAPATGGARGSVLLYGHLDKQPPLGEWAEGLTPFRAVRRGERLYGRGTADDGYALFAATAAIELLDAGGTPRPRTVVLVEASEESGSPDLPAYLDELAPTLGRPDLVVCLDSGCLSYDRLWLTTSLRGVVVATVRVDVLSEGVHSGSAGGIVPTSFRLLRQLLDRVEDPATGEVRLAALRAPAGAEGEGGVAGAGEGDVAGAGEGGVAGAGEGDDRELPAVAETFPVVGGLRLEGRSDADRLHRRAWSAAVAVTGMDGLPAVRDGGNVLRPFTAAKLSVRLPPTADADAAAGALRDALLADPPAGARVRVELETPATGWVCGPLPPWVREALDEASLARFGKRAGTLGEGGTIPFLSMLGARYPGVPLVATGVLGPGSNAHGPNEHLHLPMAVAVTEATAALVAAAARAADTAPAPPGG